MGRDDELHVGETRLEPEADLTLPFRVQVGIDLVDQDDAVVRYDLTPLLFSNQVIGSMDAHDVSNDIDQQRQGRPITLAHVGQGEDDIAGIPQPEPFGIDFFNP